jgi:hypothetical protein
MENLNPQIEVIMIVRSLHWFFRTVVILVVGFFGSGCSSGGDELPREAVSGTVTLDGQPMAKGTIRFSPASQGNQSAAVEGGGMIESGAFSIPRDRGLIPGSYQVAIYAGGAGASSKGAQGPATGGPAPKKESIPAKYNSKSTLNAVVKKGDANTFKFDLTSN